MSDTLIQVKNLSVTFELQGGDVEAVRNISFEVGKGEVVAIVGESGSGKSVTALSLLKLHDKNVFYPGGKILYKEKDLMPLTDIEMQKIRGSEISMIFQEPMTSLNPVYPIGKQIQESLLLHKSMSQEQAYSRAIDLLDRVGIRDPIKKINSFPHTLSGGQRQRVMIAMALACEPALLIADEPTTALDVTIQKQILELLVDLQRELGMSVLLITHDLNLVRRYAQRVCVMKKGEIVEQGMAGDIFSQPEHEYTKYLLNSEPNERIANITPSSTPILVAKNIRCHFPVYKGFFNRQVDAIKAVDDVSLALNEGETLGIVGESGSGKTTLCMSLLRLINATGEVSFKNKDISSFKEQEMRPLRRHFQVVFQDPFSSLSPRMTVEQIVGEGLKLHFPQLSGPQQSERILQILDEVGLEADTLWRYPHEFSGGQRQRIAIARTLVLEPAVIVLDEPTSALDVSVQKQVLALLADIQTRHQLSYLFISHDLRVIRSMSHRVIVMRNGQVVEYGTVEDVFDRPQQEYTRELSQASLYQ